MEQKALGFGCASSPIDVSIDTFLAMGLPRMALARAMGVSFAPRVLQVRATFDTPDVGVLPSKSFSDKVAQDYIVQSMIVRITTDTPAANVFEPQSRYFNQFMDGIEATLDVQGAPRFTVAGEFTPLSMLADVCCCDWPAGWGLTYQQQIIMSFQSRIQLPDFPTTVIVGFRMWGPTGEMFENMPTAYALEQLQACGYQIPQCYSRACK
jgi:hypothetical protein